MAKSGIRCSSTWTKRAPVTSMRRDAASNLPEGPERALRVRLDFMLFHDVSAFEDCTDHTTIRRFRNALGKVGLNAAILEEANRQLSELGPKVANARTAVVDATVIESAARPGNPAGKVEAEVIDRAMAMNLPRRRTSTNHRRSAGQVCPEVTLRGRNPVYRGEDRRRHARICGKRAGNPSRPAEMPNSR